MKDISETKKGITASTMHVLAMALMLCDHLWATVIMGNTWLTSIGRIAYPLFAFMLVEGYFHTRDIKKYLKRLLLCALISEVPFNLVYSGSVFYPYHQNVIWTLMIAILCIMLTEKLRRGRTKAAKRKKSNAPDGRIKKLLLSIAKTAGGILIFAAGASAAFAALTDYYGFGVLTAAVFYFFRGRKWWNYLLQFAGLYVINFEMMGGLVFNIELFGHSFEFVQQGLAVLAMIPIIIYNGERGYHSTGFRYFCYLFYPVHLLVLAVLMLWV